MENVPFLRGVLPFFSLSMKRFNHTKKKGIIQKNQDFKIIFYQMPQIMKQGEGVKRKIMFFLGRVVVDSIGIYLAR
ncbi:MAG: hypothetical protein EB051_01200 [Chlamydiia bacterium]|nr:hypothetical protein [Chlamydiia bacterium]